MHPSDPAFVELSRKVDLILANLVGDPMKGKPGIVPTVHRMTEDMYGLDSEGREIDSKKNTVLIRLSKIEDKHKYVTWFFGGALAIVAFAKYGWTGLTEFLSKLK